MRLLPPGSGAALALAIALLSVAGAGARPALREATTMANDVGRARFYLAREGKGLVVPSHSAAGWLQRARLLPDGRTEVTVVVVPALPRASAPFPRPEPPDDPMGRWLRPPEETPADVAALAEELVRGVTDQIAASTLLVQWVSLNIEHRDQPAHDDSALATLQSRTGSCVGRSELAVALLRAARIPARTVHGLVVRVQRADGPSAFMLHRYVETWIDGLGWLPSDPGDSIHVVDADHLFIAADDAPYDPESQRTLSITLAEPLTPLSSSPSVTGGARRLLLRRWGGAARPEAE